MKKELADIDLCNLIKRGDIKALEYLYKINITSLLAYGFSFCGRKEIVHDAIHDLFIKIYMNRKKLTPTTNLTAYLVLALRNTIINTMKLESREKNCIESYLKTLSENDVSLSFIKDDKDLKYSRRLKKIIKQLPVKQRKALLLHYDYGLSHGEIALKLGIKNQSVKNLLFRSIANLRKFFNDFTE